MKSYCVSLSSLLGLVCLTLGCQATSTAPASSPSTETPEATAVASSPSAGTPEATAPPEEGASAPVEEPYERVDEDGTRPFVTTWVGKRIRIPLPESTEWTYKYDVDCDHDGIYEVVGQDTNMSCKYDDEGPHTIAIRGEFPHMQADQYLGETIRSVDQWGDIEWRSMFSMFEEAKELVIRATDAPDLSKVKTLHGMFHGAHKMNQPIGHWDTSQVEDMSAMFQDAYMFNQDISSWDVSNVKDMSLMFCHAESFDQEVGSWDVSNVEDMSMMFLGALSFNKPLAAWNTANVVSLSHMFKNTREFNQPIGAWKTSNVTRINEMFSGAKAFDQPIGGWDTSKVETMHNIFAFNPAFNQPLEGWDVSGVSNLSGIFWKAERFDQALEGWDYKSMSSTQKMLSESGLSRAHYDALIKAWAARPPEVDRQLIIDAHGLKFCDAREARQKLIDEKGWTFEGDALSCDGTKAR